MIQLLAGDCRDVLPTLAADSVQTVVTSPPYYALRSYLPDGHADKHREIGSEATPDEYLATMVAVFREVRRVLRPDGTCWVNMGDSYNANQGTAFDTNRDGGGRKNLTMSPKVSSGGLAAKQLLMMPARLALALQADGWWLRSDIIWHKPNPMPESVTDRPTSAHEHVFLLTKRSRYYFDGAAIAEAATQPFGAPRLTGQHKADADGFTTNGHGNSSLGSNQGAATRACRNVWTLATESFNGAHFATFPSALAERCIRAGTSERGACSQCGAPWGRQTSVSYTDAGNGNNNMKRKGGGDYEAAMSARPYDVRKLKDVETLGWSPSCRCGTTETRPCVVLDPFAGAGTTLLVADRLQRDAVGIELSPDYTRMAMQRCQDDAPLFTSFPPAETDAQDERMRDLFREAAD